MLYDAHLKAGQAAVIAATLILMPQPVLSQENKSSDFSECQRWGDGVRNISGDQIHDAFKCLFSRIDELEKEVRPFKKAKGAVIAFDRSEEDACPAGWSRFDPAGGRVIVGAGANNNVDMNGLSLTRHPSHKDDSIKGAGGAENHMLKAAEIPEVDVRFNKSFYGFSGSAHSMTLGSGNLLVAGCPYPPGGSGNDCNDTAKRPGERYSAKAGSETLAQAHNNMPPFVSLYYCKKN